MSTIDKIKEEGLAALQKLSRGEKLSPIEKEVLKIFNSLTSGKSKNGGSKWTHSRRRKK